MVADVLAVVVAIRVWLIPAAKSAEAEAAAAVEAAACADGDLSSKLRKWEKNKKAHKSLRREHGERSERVRGKKNIKREQG